MWLFVLEGGRSVVGVTVLEGGRPVLKVGRPVVGVELIAGGRSVVGGRSP